MVPYIAIRSILGNLIGKEEGFPLLKQHALLFDKIYLPYIGKYISASNCPRHLKLELEWLLEMGIIADSGLYLYDEQKEEEAGIVDIINELSDQLSGINKRIKRRVPKGKTINDVVEKLLPLMAENDTIASRILSIYLETIEDSFVFPILPLSAYLKPTSKTKKSDVVQIVVNKFPTLEENTPWEQILDYRNDADSQKNRMRLRRWIRNISSEGLSAIEIKEELEWLTDEYESHMKLHKLKANVGTIETFIKWPLEIIEDLIKIKFSKIPEPIFSLYKRKISLMEAENNAPGREIAYLIKTKDVFQNQI